MEKQVDNKKKRFITLAIVFVVLAGILIIYTFVFGWNGEANIVHLGNATIRRRRDYYEFLSFYLAIVSFLFGISQLICYFTTADTTVPAEKKKAISTADNISDSETLLKFKDLLDAGAITQEEFDAKKKQLLGL